MKYTIILKSTFDAKTSEDKVFLINKTTSTISNPPVKTIDGIDYHIFKFEDSYGVLSPLDILPQFTQAEVLAIIENDVYNPL